MVFCSFESFTNTGGAGVQALLTPDALVQWVPGMAVAVLVFMLPQAPSLSNVISYHDYDGHLISWLMIIVLFDATP